MDHWLDGGVSLVQNGGWCRIFVHYTHCWRTFFLKNRYSCQSELQIGIFLFFLFFKRTVSVCFPRTWTCLISYGACNECFWNGCPLNQTDRLWTIWQTDPIYMLTPASKDVSPALAYPEINGTCVLFCVNSPLLSRCQQPGSLGLRYFILTDQSVTVNFAPMLLIWLAGSIRFWRIDLMSPSFFNMPCGTGYVSRCRSWQPLGSQEPWPIKGHMDDSDCFYFDFVEIGHFL